MVRRYRMDNPTAGRFSQGDMLEAGAGSVLLESATASLDEAIITFERTGDLTVIGEAVESMHRDASRIVAVAVDGSLCPHLQQEAARTVDPILSLIGQIVADLTNIIAG
jgi:hypothetical protein